MSFQTPKTDWTDSDVPGPSHFIRIEHNTLVVRNAETLPLLLEVLDDYPAHAQGRAFYHSVNERVYTSTGTAWV